VQRRFVELRSVPGGFHLLGRGLPAQSGEQRLLAARLVDLAKSRPVDIGGYDLRVRAA
jgi:hypothetical protein